MNEVLAAPASFLPSELTALVAQDSAMHFFMKEVLAAPDSALPGYFRFWQILLQKSVETRREA